MTTVPRALLAIDAGAATTSVAVLGRPGSRWRLLGSMAAPAGTHPDALATILARRLGAVDPALAAELDI
ncbi:MAG TPA: hypothetical protein VHR16_03840, partial [Candidatus Limnocylindrales bacterium]|nr:hypothetical protein [Candidatus Limnocylindrales bacterium]